MILITSITHGCANGPENKQFADFYIRPYQYEQAVGQTVGQIEGQTDTYSPPPSIRKELDNKSKGKTKKP